MKPLFILAISAFLLAGCGQFSMVPAGSNVIQGLSFTSTSDWNKSPSAPTSNSEVWTKDGLALNELLFIYEVEDGASLFRQSSDELPMPSYRSSMLPNEIEELVKTSLINAMGGEIPISTSNLRPMPIEDIIGFRFEFDFYTTEGLAIRGDVLAIPDNELLNVIIYKAASMHYYEKDLEEVNAIFESIRL